MLKCCVNLANVGPFHTLGNVYRGVIAKQVSENVI